MTNKLPSNHCYAYVIGKWIMPNLSNSQKLCSKVINEARGKVLERKKCLIVKWIGWISWLWIVISFFRERFFLFWIGNNSVNRADSARIILGYQNFGPTLWEFDFGILVNFWNCVGGTHMRRCFNFKKVKRIKLIMLFIFVYETKGIDSILCQPTQFSST